MLHGMMPELIDKPANELEVLIRKIIRGSIFGLPRSVTFNLVFYLPKFFFHSCFFFGFLVNALRILP